MTSLSITLPDDLAQASQLAAKKLGVSRTQFIRRAVAHELQHLQAKLEQDEIIRSIRAMKKDPEYLKEAESITTTLHADLPIEDEWWKN